MARKVIMGSRWLLLRNADNLEREQAVKLEELLAANASLTTAYAQGSAQDTMDCRRRGRCSMGLAGVARHDHGQRH
ncbi:transposase [Onishia taeanensis]